MEKKCIKCGHILDEDSLYCENCGTKILNKRQIIIKDILLAIILFCLGASIFCLVEYFGERQSGILADIFLFLVAGYVCLSYLKIQYKTNKLYNILYVVFLLIIFILAIDGILRIKDCIMGCR